MIFMFHRRAAHINGQQPACRIRLRLPVT